MYLCDMKMKKILHASVLVLVLSVIGMVSYYLIWILLDEEAWQMFLQSRLSQTSDRFDLIQGEINLFKALGGKVEN